MFAQSRFIDSFWGRSSTLVLEILAGRLNNYVRAGRRAGLLFLAGRRNASEIARLGSANPERGERW